MNTVTLLLILSVTLLVFISIFLWLFIGWTHPKVSHLRQTPKKEASSPQASSGSGASHSPQASSGSGASHSPQASLDSRASYSPEGGQRSIKNFASPSLPSQRPLDHMHTNNSRPALSSAPSNSRYAEEKPKMSISGNRSVEHYEQCIRASYEPRIDGISLVFTNTVITNAIEVDNVFTVCERQFKEVMRARGWERVGWIADLGGYNLVGMEATTLVGETLKLFLDKFGLKTKGGLYLIAHYSSKAAPPDQEELNEKLKRIQFITAGVINEFQGNVFDTREEAIAFYLRLRQELQAGR